MQPATRIDADASGFGPLWLPQSWPAVLACAHCSHPLREYIQTDIICHEVDRLPGRLGQPPAEFPEDARQDAGYQLDKVQRGEQPNDFKLMPSIGQGVEEIRVWDEAGTFRLIYTARIGNTVVVLHAFQKKAQATSKRDIDLARARWSQLKKEQ